MTLYVGDTNIAFRVNAGYDMTSFTELTLTFTKPDLTNVTKTTTDGVILGTGVVDSDIGTLPANEYVEYPIEASFLDQAGTWYVTLKYTDTTTTPDSIYNGPCVAFTVTSVTCG
jgi:hypothetical protein